jgi:predicted ribosomally synthesized peptide with SipW-like signal peptide
MRVRDGGSTPPVGLPHGGDVTMTDRRFQLSRRKILAGLGAVGAAGAGAGLGTSAFFSDEEVFEGNTFTAGTLDLKVDWEEHYSYPQLYGFDDPTADLDVTRSEPSDPAGYVALPDPQNPAVWVAQSDLDAYMNATSIEAYPDVDDDGIQDAFGTEQVGDICVDGADTSEDLDPSGLRTNNADTEGGAPLLNLEDVKPGDFGEVTLSFHLCDNPGLVWMQGDLVSADENGVTEPEADSPDEVDGEVELLDEIQSVIWYDDGDNVLETGGTESDESDVMIVFDSSGSMDNTQAKIDNAKQGAKDLVDALGPGARAGLVTFEDAGEEAVAATLADSNSQVKTAIDGITPDGGTAMGNGINLGQSELQSGAGARSGADKILVVISNGSANEGDDPITAADSAKSAGTTIFSIAYGSGANESLMEDVSSPPKNDDGTIDNSDEHAFIGDQSDIQSIFQGIGQTISSGESVIMRDSLRNVLDALADGIPLDANPTTEGQDCYQNSTTQYIGFGWHLPLGVGNHVQSDTVAFNLGFRTEQCRNNDG